MEEATFGLYVVITMLYMLGFVTCMAMSVTFVGAGMCKKPKYPFAIVLVSLFWFLLAIVITKDVYKAYREL